MAGKAKEEIVAREIHKRGEVRSGKCRLRGVRCEM
jgi:hypothetical protein